MAKRKEVKAARRAAARVAKAEADAAKLRDVASWLKVKSRERDLAGRSEYLKQASIVAGVAEALPALAAADDVESMGAMLGVLRRWGPVIAHGALATVGLAADTDQLTGGKVVGLFGGEGAPPECFDVFIDPTIFDEWEALGVTVALSGLPELRDVFGEVIPDDPEPFAPKPGGQRISRTFTTDGESGDNAADDDEGEEQLERVRGEEAASQGIPNEESPLSFDRTRSAQSAVDAAARRRRESVEEPGMRKVAGATGEEREQFAPPFEDDTES